MKTIDNGSTQKNFNQKLGSILIIMILICSGLFIIMPPNSIFSMAIDVPSSTEKIDSDFINGTFNNTEIYIIGNDAVLGLNSSISNSNNWIEKKLDIEPDKRLNHAMATIWGTDKILLYGGANFTSGVTIYNDTWVYDYSENNWTEMSPPSNPGEIYFHAMASIYGTDKVLLFSPHSSPLINTWIYDLSNNSWTEKANIPYNYFFNGAAMASVFGTDKVVLFGTISTLPQTYNETWIFDLSNNTWTNKTPKDPTKSPTARTDHAMASIYGTQKVLLYGGSFTNFSYWIYYNETWIYDLLYDTWSRILTPTLPNARERHAMATLYGTDRVLLYGCWAGLGSKNDTWIFDYSENAWINTTPTNNPGNLSSHAMAFVYGTTSAVIFGGVLKTGSSSYQISDETWTYNCLLFKENGTYISSPYYIGPNSSLKILAWNASTSNESFIEFQLRSAKSELDLGSKPFIGIDGTSSSCYSDPGSNIWAGHENDSWVQYKAYLKSINIMDSPSLKNVTIVYNRWPNTTLVYPPNDCTLLNNTPTFSWNFTDFDSTNQTAFQVVISNNITFETIKFDSNIQSSKDFTWQFPLGTSYKNIPGGIWYWKVRTKDNDGDWGLYSMSWRFTIDSKAPGSIITNPLNNGFYNGLNTISGKAYDSIDGAGLNKTEIAINRLNDDSYWTGQKWIDSESWLITSGTTKWTYDTSSIIWHSGFKYNIQSRAIDNATNIEIPKPGKIITMDFDNVTFSNAFPSFADVSPTEGLEVGITISDKISGVNASTIEYIISEDEGKTWTYWELVTGLESGKTINVTLNLNFPNGTGNRIKWRAMDIAGNGPKESRVYVIRVNTWLMELSIPKVKLWSPPNGSIIASTALELSWRLTNKDLLNVTYDVYLDTVNPPVNINHSGIINTRVIIDNLSNGVTYYWTVMPKTEKINGSCESGVWSFIITIPIPKINLISPENNSIIYDFQPRLSWSVEYDGTEILTYDVYFGTSEDPELKFKEHPSTNCFIKKRLTDGETYYWRIVPWAGDYPGLVSETWSFTVKKDYIPHFELELFILSPVIELPPGDIRQVKAIVSNLGELEDSILLRIEVPPDSGVGAIVQEPSIISVIPHGIAEFNIMVTTSMDAPNEEMILTVVASSRRATEYDLIVEERSELTVKIMSEEKKDEDNPWLSFSGFWFIFLIIIIILIVLIIVWMVIKHKKTSQETKDESTPEDALTVKPGTVREAEISVGQAQPTTTSLQLLETTANVDSQQQTQTIAKVPTLASPTTPGQVPEPKQIPQVTQVPQLPSAQSETAETRGDSTRADN